MADPPFGAERNAGESPRWTHAIVGDPDGTYRVEITDEDGEVFPVARQVTRGQAERLVQRIAAEAVESHKPVKVVIRDPYFLTASQRTLVQCTATARTGHISCTRMPTAAT